VREEEEVRDKIVRSRGEEERREKRGKRLEER